MKLNKKEKRGLKGYTYQLVQMARRKDGKSLGHKWQCAVTA